MDQNDVSGLRRKIESMKRAMRAKIETTRYYKRERDSYRAFYTVSRENFNEVRDLNCRADTLGSAAWRATVRSEVLGAVDVQWTLRPSAKAKIEELLRRLERKERCSLIDLAMLRAGVKPAFSTLEEVREYVILDPAFDPSEFLLQTRATNGSGVVIPLVMDFLGP